MSFRSPVSEWLLAVVGTQRVLVLDIFRDILVVQSPDGAHGTGDVLKSSLRAYWQGLAGFVTSGALFSAGQLFYGHETLVRRFVDSIIDGSPLPVPPEEGLAVVQTMQSILEQTSLSGVQTPLPNDGQGVSLKVVSTT
jgi:hypothetical protein